MEILIEKERFYASRKRTDSTDYLRKQLKQHHRCLYSPQVLLGHSSITLNIYTHVLDKKMDEELKKFGSAKTQEREAYAGLDVKKAKITALSHC